jgi:hypothetical protein
LAISELEEILQAYFDWDTCPPGEKFAKEAVLIELIKSSSARHNVSYDSLRSAIESRYPDYRYRRLKTELPSVPQRFRRS